MHLELPGAAETRARGASSNNSILNETFGLDIYVKKIVPQALKSRYILISCKEVSLFGLLTNVFRELDVVQGTESCSKYPELKIYTDQIQPGSSWVSDLLSPSLLCCCLTNLCCNLVLNLKSPDTAKLSSWSQSFKNNF